MPARVLVLAVAVVLAGYALIERHDTRRCTADARQVLASALSTKPSLPTGLVPTLIADCRGSHTLALAANGLARVKRLPEALALANEAIRREPGNYEGWAALAETLQRRGLDGASRRALARAVALNPRYGQTPG